MGLLRFSVGNFRSIKDIVTLDLAPKLGDASKLTGLTKEITEPVAAIFGPNGSGKSNLLEALQFTHDAIVQSAISWQIPDASPTQPHFPFKVNKEAASQPSFFEFDFTIGETRYLYGFTYGCDGVVEEWLSYVPKRRWSSGFIRNHTKTPEIDWNGSYITKDLQKNLDKVDKRELLLSTALRNNDSPLQEVAHSLVSSFTFLSLGRLTLENQIRQLASRIQKNHFDLDELSLLMQAADTGVKAISLDEEKIPTRVLRLINGFDTGKATLNNDEAELVVHNLEFTHDGGKNSTFKLSEESAGTLTWLSIAPILLQTLREGTILVVDELDSNLHQKLIEMIITCFTDSTINQHGAQLIFITHNTSIIEHMDDLSLGTETIWFMEKSQNGESSLFSLAYFPKHSDTDYEHSYLEGRYGALPYLSPAILRGLADEPSSEGRTYFSSNSEAYSAVRYSNPTSQDY